MVYNSSARHYQKNKESCKRRHLKGIKIVSMKKNKEKDDMDEKDIETFLKMKKRS